MSIRRSTDSRVLGTWSGHDIALEAPAASAQANLGFFAGS